MSDAQFWTFLVAITLLTMSPGVDTLLVLRNTARGGWRDGLTSSLGICSGLFVHAVISAVGISVILLQSAWAFSVLKLAGAVYLIWLGIQGLRSMRKMPVGQTLKVKHAGFIVSRSLREGLLSNVLNPKAVVFYMAFLPQFIDPTGNMLMQSLLLAAIHFVIGMIWLSGLTYLLHRAKGWALGQRFETLLQGMTGVVMIGIGVKLAIDR
ncbi:MAG: threonine transporter RhtB [Sedimenticola sp.]|jgi:RhtB (resistance to homoserine/threonine) family protein|nr:MAG: threonine transporter RhtB [Sedimenticola sp.]